MDTGASGVSVGVSTHLILAPAIGKEKEQLCVCQAAKIRSKPGPQ